MQIENLEAVFATTTVQREVLVFDFTYLPRCVKGGHNDQTSHTRPPFTHLLVEGRKPGPTIFPGP